MNDVQWINLMS